MGVCFAERCDLLGTILAYRPDNIYTAGEYNNYTYSINIYCPVLWR